MTSPLTEMIDSASTLEDQLVIADYIDELGYADAAAFVRRIRSDCGDIHWGIELGIGLDGWVWGPWNERQLLKTGDGWEELCRAVGLTPCWDGWRI